MPDAGPESWLTRFEPFGAFHATAVGVCVAVIFAWCAVGRVLRARPTSERRFSMAVGCVILAWQAFATVWRLLPGNFELGESLPLHLCRVTGVLAGVALIWPSRRARGLLFFWGLGLSTQGFATPMWPDGLASVAFWLYWVGHTQIVGAAVYDLAVRGFRPGVRDWGFAALMGLAYAGLTVAVNLAIGTNYSYLGRGEYDAASLVDHLGPWPGRAVAMVLGAQAIFLLLFGASAAWSWVERRRSATGHEPLGAAA
jgi:hypothetical integral membrane protein (TIGR02206 family)